VGMIEAAQVDGAGMETVEEPHRVGSDLRPGGPIETRSKAVRPRSAATIHPAYRVLYLSQVEWGHKDRPTDSWQASVETAQVESPADLTRPAQQREVYT
jgi:hypothetical protein